LDHLAEFHSNLSTQTNPSTRRNLCTQTENVISTEAAHASS
jgi:hypothetical protein